MDSAEPTGTLTMDEQTAPTPLINENSEPQQPPADGVRAFDQQGREVIVPREEWRTNVLPNLLKEVWDQPENLYMVLLNSFNDGFFAETAEAAEHLFETDPVKARGACMWAIALAQTDRVELARTVLEGYLESHPVDASVLVNLAKVYAAQGEDEKADAALERALQLDPNHDAGLNLLGARTEQRHGPQAAAEALHAITANPLSWRAQVWLARGALQAGDLPTARNLYLYALDRAPRPVPPELLMQMSGDLGARGHLAELIDLTAPYYLPETHGLPVGNNLIKANVDLGRLGSAESIKSSLERLNAAMNRPDWHQALNYWNAEIARRRGQGAPQGQGEAQPAQLQIGLLRIDGPIWLPGNSPARGIFGQKPQGGPSVTFLGGTAEAPEDIPAPQERTPEQARQAELVARMTRALPLFLAEQTDLLTGAHGRAMLPWAVGPQSGFLVSGAAWTDELAVQMLNEPANRSDYVVSTHLDAEVEPWTAMLAFVRTADGTRIGEIEHEFDPANPEEGLRQLAAEVVELLGSAAGRPDRQAAYTVPAGDGFLSYLQRLESLLAVRCAGMPGVPPTFLTGEGDILGQDLALASAEPGNVAARLILLETLAATERVRPEATSDFREPVKQLSTDHPIPALDAAFANT